MSDTKMGGTGGDTDANAIWTDNFMDELMNMFLMHLCIQLDPGEPKTWKEALAGPE